MPVKNLEIKMVGPFKNVNFNFDKKVNVLIGPNNCGKSTALMCLAEAIVFPFAVPKKLIRKEGKPKMSISLWENDFHHSITLPWATDSNALNILKMLGYTSFIPALRENTGFRPKSPMGEGSTEPSNIERRVGKRMVRYFSEDIFDSDKKNTYPISLNDEIIKKISYEEKLSKNEEAELKKRRILVSSPSVITDRAIVSKIVELDYRAYRKNDSRFRKPISIAANISSEIMSGFPIKFDRIEEDKRGLYPEFETPDGPLSLDKLSQGTQSIIQWMSHLILGMAEYYNFPKNLNRKKAVFIIDEIDAHMHPEWQRRIIPTLTKNLPNCQFFISTHSPLIISGLKEGQIQLLKRCKDGDIKAVTNERETVGWSVDETLRWLMDMGGTLDHLTEMKVEALNKLRKKNKLSKKEQGKLEQLRNEIHTRLKKRAHDSI